MPPTLDLSRTAHSNLIVSPARINLRRAASYTHEKGPLSSTSSRFNFNHLLFASPPPSPGLPQLVTRPRRPSTAPRPRRVFRVTMWALGILAVLYLGASSLSAKTAPVVNESRRADVEYELVGQDDLPDFPTPIMVTDNKGKAKWTISIPPNYDFPLTAKTYSDICAKCREVADQVHLMNHERLGSQPTSRVHNQLDQHFIDVREAEDAGYLPGSVSIGTLLRQQRHAGDLIGEDRGSLVDKPVCSTSMTFVLASADAGMGQTLMLLWVLYALAQREERAFFIDDTRWAYGRYTDIFAAPPIPDCRPPLRHEMLPCPRQARHLVANLETARGVLEETIAKHDTDILASTETLFGLARQGYEDLFVLNQQDADYVANRAKELTAKTKIRSMSIGKDGMIIGIHVRRGDRHPHEFQYQDSYIPTNMYTERAREIVNSTYYGDEPISSEVSKGHSMIVVASDDPLVYESGDFAGAARAQDQIRLASKSAIQQANPDRSAMHKFVDETFGWEGGFFAAMFWNLGVSTPSATNAGRAPPETGALPPSAETIQLRSLLGRAYMLDLAVLSAASDVMVCTASAMGCRLLAVMMGWEAAMESGAWVNIDGDQPWTGISW